MAVSFTGRVTIPATVLTRDLDGESVILNLDNESYFGLDEVGTRMLSVLLQSDSVQHAYETLLQEYEVTPEQLREDLQSFIQNLADHGIVEVTA